MIYLSFVFSRVKILSLRFGILGVDEGSYLLDETKFFLPVFSFKTFLILSFFT